MKVMVLLGGESTEREVSLETGNAIAAALESRDHRVTVFDPNDGTELPLVRTRRFLQALEEETPDVVFVALHGGAGEDGRIQAVLDLAGVPYTGSGVLASGLAMDKVLAKEVFRQRSIPTPDWHLLHGPDPEMARRAIDGLGGYPIVVKPVNGGSTVGITILQNAEGLAAALESAFAADDRAFLEVYVPGREITVAVIDGESLPVVEIIPQSGFYDYEAKYTLGKSQYVVPAQIEESTGERMSAHARVAFEALGCRGAARVDFRLNPETQSFCLEVNTIPGMTATSLVPMAAKVTGVKFPELVERMCQSALRRGS